MSNTRLLTYRGDIKALAADDGGLVFVTVHQEGQPTPIYRVDSDKWKLSEEPLPAGGLALLIDEQALWIAGSDGRLYRAPRGGGTPEPVAARFDPPAQAFAKLSRERLAVLSGTNVFVVSRAEGGIVQTLPLDETGTCIAADPTGDWLVVGTERGTILVFQSEEQPEFKQSAADRLHDGAVTAVLFEPDELRFLSAGMDQKLLSTLARGKLEPEDRGRNDNHSKPIPALIWGPGDRFYSGSRDKSVKSWPRSRSGRPVTFKEGLPRVNALAIVKVHNKPHLAFAGDDNTIQVLALDKAGKFGEEVVQKVYDGYAWAKHELGRDDAARREAALRALAGFNDTRALEMLAGCVEKEESPNVRLTAAQLLAGVKHARAARLLEPLIQHKDEAVRVAAFHGLRQQLGADDLKPTRLALATGKADVGKLAVEALEKIAQTNDLALAALTEALQAATREIRLAALTSLEKAYPPRSPEAGLTALNSAHPDVRRLALLRFRTRGMLTYPRVQASLRRATEDGDADVRRAAFLLSLFTREKLVAELRRRDADLERQIQELEGSPSPASPASGAAALKLEARDLDPLLQATASRSLDTSLRGARGLAMLGDARAFGLLLQLSREEDVQARAEVCRCLAALDDPRSIQRLRSLLHDAAVPVRDAAFTALEHFHRAEPLRAAESGLIAGFEDVRRRALEVLIRVLRAKPTAPVEQSARRLLLQALNDSFENIRGEAFKSALNLQVGGGGLGTLRFALQSVHASVRREVLTEVMAQTSENWAWNLLLEFFNDHEPRLREEAFAFAVQKNKEIEPLQAALRAQYADTRLRAVDGLVKKHTEAAQQLLLAAVSDQAKEVRLRALNALISADAQAALVKALQSEHIDVRVESAKALARAGLQAALAPLLAVATAPEPTHKERVPDWIGQVEAALDGLALLGDPSARGQLAPLLNSPHAGIRKQAAAALVWICRPESFETLRQALQHADPQVKYRAALGLACCGDASVAALVFSEPAAQVLKPEEKLYAALALGPTAEEHLIVFLDHDDEALRAQALLLLMLRELEANEGSPTRSLACLSSRMPRVRLAAARALEAYSSPEAFLRFVVHAFNDKGDSPAWKIGADTVACFARLVVRGAPQTRARTAQLLKHLSVREQAAFDQAWKLHSRRHAAEIAKLLEAARAQQPVAARFTREQLLQLAFGAYVGLVREQGGSDNPSLGAAIVRVRQTALHRILALAKQDAAFAAAAKPVFLQALRDPHQEVRLQAFEHLQQLGLEGAALGGEALEAGHTDLGIKGLEMLSGKAQTPEGQAILVQVMQTRNDHLAEEAAKLLVPLRGTIAVATQGLAAAYAPMRKQAVNWLAAEFDKNPAAQEALRLALTSRDPQVRERAALELARKKDPGAFPTLAQMLAEAQDESAQNRAIEALTTLGDPRAAGVFLDRLDNDPSGTALAEPLLRAAAGFRDPSIADRLYQLLNTKRKLRRGVLQALITVSGFDQPLEDPDDERSDKRWEEKQHPRRPAILARVLDRCYTLGESELLSGLIMQARWARGVEVEPILALLTSHPDDDVRRRVVEAIGWRVRKRGSGVEPLLRAVQSKDQLTQLLAAEGLARVGRAEGLNVLLASIDYVEDVEMRRRAVLALGESGDARALDPLLRYANEAGHALQEAAAEAIGHLGKTEKADDIFQLLQNLGRGEGGVAEGALKGLRWLDTQTGWKLIRRRAEEPGFLFRETAVDLLGYNDDPASRDLLQRILSEGDDIELVTSFALPAARRLWGPEALEPDYAVLRNRSIIDDDDFPHIDELEDALQRVCTRGDARRSFEILPFCIDYVRQTLTSTLLNRAELPIAEAREALANPNERSVQLAAKILGRAGALAADAAQPLREALLRWLEVWQRRRQRMAFENSVDERLTALVTPCAESLLWAAGRIQAGWDVVLKAAEANSDDLYYRPIRREAVAALTSGPKGGVFVAALERAAVGSDPEVRTLAAEALARQQPARMTELAPKLLADGAIISRLAAHAEINLEPALRTAAGQLHYQGVALPHLIQRRDRDGLVAVVDNRQLPLDTRLGAVEGLARLLDETAETKLAEVGKSASEPEELRKEAWRGLRRSKRARAATAKALAAQS